MVGSSLVQLPLAFLSRFFNSLSMTLLVSSICPLLCGCSTEVSVFDPQTFMEFLNSFVNKPCSIVRDQGVRNVKSVHNAIPNEFLKLASEMVVMGLACIHFVI